MSLIMKCYLLLLCNLNNNCIIDLIMSIFNIKQGIIQPLTNFYQSNQVFDYNKFESYVNSQRYYITITMLANYYYIGIIKERALDKYDKLKWLFYDLTGIMHNNYLELVCMENTNIQLIKLLINQTYDIYYPHIFYVHYELFLKFALQRNNIPIINAFIEHINTIDHMPPPNIAYPNRLINKIVINNSVTITENIYKNNYSYICEMLFKAIYDTYITKSHIIYPNENEHIHLRIIWTGINIELFIKNIPSSNMSQNEYFDDSIENIIKKLPHSFI